MKALPITAVAAVCVIDRLGFCTVSAYALSTTAPTLSVARTVKLKAPRRVGVPESVPLEFKVSPCGSGPPMLV